MNDDLSVDINVWISSQIVVRTKSFGYETKENDPDHKKGHELFDVTEACPDKVNKKTHLFSDSQVLENLNDDVCNDYNIQENVKNNPKVDIKLTVHSNKLSSCIEEPDDKVDLVADEGHHVEHVHKICDIFIESFNAELNPFIIELEKLPNFTDYTKAKGVVPC